MKRINNAFYEQLGDGWYTDSAHPIALLRKENEARNPWILSTIEKLLGPGKHILDIGCGGGFLTNALSLAGHSATGIDLSPNSLKIASMQDTTGKVRFLQANALDLPFDRDSFDVVCAMDLLEHVEEPARVIAEASRVLKVGGLFFFHTFNRNFLSWLIVIKGVEWSVPNTPPRLHVYPLFIKPKELSHWCSQNQIAIQELKGLMPKIASLAFWKGFLQRKVHEKMQFRFSPSLKMGYVGYGIKDV
ncbi:MAG TPA: bifunctional 2-polyprenyl-6-hydroxyphenol methylase/3-demethylubiquinol 3-O-methyltransferase UbiG [Rhabdochlamydiaceae bacterium]|jgi:2-polyprenyl-6-hydroxyphenyl methylase/3-demethylubiquinone-9 3-methyltransferase